MRKPIGFVFLIFGILLMGCASTGRGSNPSTNNAVESQDEGSSTVYAGAGQNRSLLLAQNQAKMDAVNKYIRELVGADIYRTYEDQIRQQILSTSNPNQFVNEASMINTRKDKIGEDYIYELTIAVDTTSIKNVLRSREIPYPGFTPSDDTGYESRDNDTNTIVTPTPTTDPGPTTPARTETTLTQEQVDFIERYLETMTYMVYFNEDSQTPGDYLAQGVVASNQHLIEAGKTVVDISQVEKVKNDINMVGEELTGDDVTVIQAVAQELSADVYVQIDFAIDIDSTERANYAQTSGTIQMIDPSTGIVMGSLPFMSERMRSLGVMEQAIEIAIRGGMFEVIPEVIRQSEVAMRDRIKNGVRFELTILNASDPAALFQFVRRMRSRVGEIALMSQSAEQAQYEIFFFGDSLDLMEAIMDTAMVVDGLEGMYPEVVRGHSLTFDSGL